MTKYLFDSDVLMDFFKKKDYAVSLVIKLTSKGKLVVSILSIAELTSGWSQKQVKNLLPSVYDLMEVLNINLSIAELAGKYRQEYGEKGITLPLVDALIGATAILENCQLVTRNKKDYPMPEIKFYQIKE